MTVGTNATTGTDAITTTTTQTRNHQPPEDGETKNGTAIATKTEDTAPMAPRAAGTATSTTAGTKRTITGTPAGTANGDGRRNEHAGRTTIGTTSTTDGIGTAAMTATAGDPTAIGTAASNPRRRRIWAR